MGRDGGLRGVSGTGTGTPFFVVFFAFVFLLFVRGRVSSVVRAGAALAFLGIGEERVEKGWVVEVLLGLVSDPQQPWLGGWADIVFG